MAEKIDKSSPWYRDDDESILEVYDVETGERTVLQEFDYLIEAPNWSPDGKFLTFNSNGRIFKFDLETKESREVFTDFVTNCNNDHVLSPEGDRIAVSHGTKEDGKSRIYTVPLTGGVPRLITPLRRATCMAGRRTAKRSPTAPSAAGSSTSIRFRWTAARKSASRTRPASTTGRNTTARASTSGSIRCAPA